jgi:hypothetical protein
VSEQSFSSMNQELLTRQTLLLWVMSERASEERERGSNNEIIRSLHTTRKAGNQKKSEEEGEIMR